MLDSLEVDIDDEGRHQEQVNWIPGSSNEKHKKGSGV